VAALPMATPREFRRICVFAGSKHGSSPDYGEAAAALGRELAAREIGLVYGGGRVGLMGTLANTVLSSGGTAIGVIPDFLVGREIAHDGLTQLLVVSSLHERLELMAELSDGFVALPGGLGTLEELLQIVSWSVLGLHRKPFGVLDVRGYFASLRAVLEDAHAAGFLEDRFRDAVIAAPDPARLIDALADWETTPSRYEAAGGRR
jgi:uncharacterized protein (TIGR00730 family)